MKCLYMFKRRYSRPASGVSTVVLILTLVFALTHFQTSFATVLIGTKTVMPVGDSLTNGMVGTEIDGIYLGNLGYRGRYLYKFMETYPDDPDVLGLLGRLDAAGVDINYVGSICKKGDNDCDGVDELNEFSHEGRNGASITDISKLGCNSKPCQSNDPGETPWKLYKPDVILLMAGTNDFLQEYEYCIDNPKNLS